MPKTDSTTECAPGGTSGADCSTLREQMAKLFVDPDTGEDLEPEKPPVTFKTGYCIVIGRNPRTGQCWRWTWKCDQVASYTERIGRICTGDYGDESNAPAHLPGGENSHE